MILVLLVHLAFSILHGVWFGCNVVEEVRSEASRTFGTTRRASGASEAAVRQSRRRDSFCFGARSPIQQPTFCFICVVFVFVLAVQAVCLEDLLRENFKNSVTSNFLNSRV